MLLSSPITSFCKDHVLFLAYPCNRSVVFSFQVLSILSSFPLLSTGVLSKLCHSCSLLLFSTGVLSYSFWSVKLLFHVLQPTRFSQCSLFLFSNGLFAISFISVVLFLLNCSTSQGSWFHSFVKEAT